MRSFFDSHHSPLIPQISLFILLILFPLLSWAQPVHTSKKASFATRDTTPKLTIMPLQGATPWTNLKLNNDPDRFQFAIVTDRTGGHRPGVFMDAVRKLNLLQPELVMSVGDLIEGYTTDMDELNRQWDEFDGFVEQLDMPFFYLPGNHDMTNDVMEDLWTKRLGPTYFHFVYHNILFLSLNSEDQKLGAGKGTISDPQYAYIKKTLADHPNVDWTLVFMHQPLWNQEETRHWNDVEELLKQRKHTVFTGHEHRYVKYRRNNANYFILATTGGGSGLRGPSLGEFDHVVWVTMTKNGPIIANLLLEGIWDENVFTEEMRSFVEEMNRKVPIQVSSYYMEGDDFEKGEVVFKITNDEDIPMSVNFDQKFSFDLLGVLDKQSLEVAPNSVEMVTLNLEKRKKSINKPITIKSEISYQPEGRETAVKIPYRFNIKPLPRYSITEKKKRIKIDGKSKDWTKNVESGKVFPYQFSADNGDMEAAFNVFYDEEYLYMAATVRDDTIVSLGEGASWKQDNVGFIISALPMAKSAMSTGRNWYEEEFILVQTPQTKTAASIEYRPLEEGIEMKCRVTEDGYFAEAKIPVSYIKKLQGDNWKTFRIQIIIDDKDGDNIHRYYWQPNWRDKEVNVVGSGMFFRE